MTTSSHIVQDQSEAIDLLVRLLSRGGGAVERIDTHGAIVLLAGDRAYKIKRAVRFPYMDFSTVEKRREAVHAELSLNRRTAPEIYLAAVPVVRTPDGELAFDGGKTIAGQAIEWVVVMRRFEQDQLFDRLAERRALAPELATELADVVLAFHEAAEPRAGFGGADGIAGILADNNAGLAEAGPDVFDSAKLSSLAALSAAALPRQSARLDARARLGLVRQCHGDLHLRNVVLWRGRPTLFDAVEFNETLACIDVLYDLAFLLMDLDHRGLRPLGNLVLNRYLAEAARRDGTGEGSPGALNGLAVLPLFLSLRAGIRAKVGVAAATAQHDDSARSKLEGEARTYLDSALAYLAPPPPLLVAIGGLSGTGKSTLARALAPNLGPAPGALILRSDVIRKRLHGAPPLERLGPEAYGPDVTARVYAAMRQEAGEALAAGHAVVADAVHGGEAERGAMEAVARQAGAAFAGLWLEAAPERLAARVAGRRKDASDATIDVLRGQLRQSTGAIGWRRIDSSGEAAHTAAAAAAGLGLAERLVI